MSISPTTLWLSSTLLALCLSTASAIGAQAGAAVASAFSTNGHVVYHLRTAQRDTRGNRAVISAAYDGTVLAHTPKGTLLWQRKVNGYFPYDLAAADIDDDGRDEIFVATAGGTVDAQERIFSSGPDTARPCISR